MILDNFFKGFFKNKSIKSGIRNALILTSTISIFFACIIFIVHDFLLFKHNEITDNYTLANIIAFNIRASVYFNDKDAAFENLSALYLINDVVCACVYNKNNKIFASYVRSEKSSDNLNNCPNELIINNRDKNNNYNFKYMNIYKDIIFEKELIGKIYIKADFSNLYDNMIPCLILAGFALFTCFVLALFLSSGFQKALVSPIVNLVKIVTHISEKKNYAIRAQRSYYQEIDELILCFNKMIGEIQTRDNKLEMHRGMLEQEVQHRTADLIAARIRADDANRAKSEFLANMSHEIRTPMNAILGFAELITKKTLDNDIQRYINAITSSGRTLLNLINDILDLSKIEAGRMTLEYLPVNPMDILNEIKQIFTDRTDEKRIEFIIEIDKLLNNTLLIDETRLRQILFNVVGNAIKFTQTGYVKLSANTYYAQKDKSSLDLVFSVEDTGTGIHKDQQEEIFEAFRQQKGQIHAQFGGTGLGLAITKRLVEMMGGEIKLESEYGKGSTFQIILKNISISATQSKSKNKSKVQEKINFNKACILSVDDIETNRVLIKEFLKEFQFDIYEAENGIQAIDMALEYNPDLILMDMKMPEMDGYEATKMLKLNEKTKSIPVVALTASAMLDNLTKITQSGCDSFINKPVSYNDLISELKKYLNYSTDKNDNKEKINTQTDEKKLIIDNEIKSKIPELLKILNSNILETLNEIQNTFTFVEIKEFGKDIISLGEKYKINTVKDWGEKIFRQADSYDMENLPATLNFLPELIKEIESLMQSY